MMEKNLNYIAKKLNLSIATVSRALNEETKDRVKLETRKRIFELIKREGFKPNIKARNLKRRKLTNFGLLLPVGIKSIFYDEYYSGILKGISAELLNTEYTLTILPIEQDYSPEQIFNILLNNETAGLILSPYCKHVKIPFEIIKKYDFPIVSVDNKVSGKNLYNIILNHKHAGYLGAEVLWGKGRRNLILISDIRKSEHSELRKEGFYEFFKNKKNKKFSIKDIEAEFSYVSGLPVLEKIIEMDRFPVGVFSLNDEIAAGMLAQLKEKDMECPKDISLLGFDGLSVGEYMVPKLSSIAFSFEKIGKIAAKILMDVVEGRKTKKTNVLEAGIREGRSL